MSEVIKTNDGIGSPGYTDDNAPKGGQWMKGVPAKHTKVPEGTKVVKTGKQNDYEPAYFCEVKLLDGPYKGELVWVKNTHIVSDSNPVVPPTSNRKVFKVVSYFENSTGKYYEFEEVKLAGEQN